MVNTGSPVNGLNRGIAIDSVKLELGTKHTEANSLLQLMGPDEHYLGLIKRWNDYQLINTPLLAATELQKNVLYTKTMGETLSYSVPVKYSLPYVTDDINETDKIGLNLEKFYLILNTDRYTKSDILTYDFEDGKQAIVDLEEPENPTPHGAGSYLYVMRPTWEDRDAYIDRRFVQEGTEWVKMTNFKNEWSEENSSITHDSDGLETLMFKTGEALQSIQHWMTGYADIIEYSATGSAAGMMDMSVMNKYKNPHDAAVQYMFYTMGDPRDPNNPDRKKFQTNGSGPGVVVGSGGWMPMIMKMMYREQAKMQERNLMYSQGGMVLHDARGTTTRLGMGYYPQLKESGNYHTYAKPEQLIPTLLQISGDLFYGRTDLPTHMRRMKWKLGQGAIIEAYKYFKRYFQNDVGFQVWAQHPALAGMLTGDSMNLEYAAPRFTTLTLPEYGQIQVEHDPSLDWVGTKNQTSFIGGYSTKSYRAFVEDLTDKSFSNAMPTGGVEAGSGYENGGNICMIKPKRFANVETSFQVGTYCPDFLRAYVGAGANSHVASTNKFGFSTTIHWAGEIWLKDPSRSILVELVDPLKNY